MYLVKYLFFGWMCCLASLQGAGQQDTAFKVSIDAKGISVPAFLNQLEQQSGLFFYYDIGAFDTLPVSLTVSNTPLRSVFAMIFADTMYYLTMDEAKHVFITKDRALNLNLPTFFTATDGSMARKSISTVVATAIDEQDNATAGLENKLFDIGQKVNGQLQGTATVAGFIKDVDSGEPIVGASVLVDKTGTGTSTDQYGFYSLTLPKGRHVIGIQSLGMNDTRRQIALYGDGKLNIDMKIKVLTLRNVTIAAQKMSNVRNTQMGLQRLDIKAIKQVPVVFGEADLIRVVTTLPGVKTVGEASTGLNVRGGAADQNLILFNEATLFNPSHFFGMFSSLNPEVVKDVELYKSSIPAKYGGRLSSVLNINSREGNKKKLSGNGGIGLLTSRLQLEGPLIKDKSSFIVAGRTTYANWLLDLLPDEYKNSKASFYDLNLNINHEFDKKNSLYFTGYISNDRFNLNSDTLFGYGNKNVSVKWKHIFNNKLTGTAAVGYDAYGYYTSSEALPPSAFKLNFDINQTYFRSHFNYYLNNTHTVEFGLNTLYYDMQPGNYQPVGEASLVVPQTINREQALESAIYISDKINISKAFTIDAGLRYSIYNYLGPQQVNRYAPNLPRTEGNQIGVDDFKGGKFINNYGGPEVRFSMRYAFNDSFSIKAGYNTQRQYLHSISNTAAMSPTDIWKLSDPNIRPQFGSQVSLGLYRNLKNNTIETSVEVYYKNISNYLDYKSGATLVMNPALERDVLTTEGKAYGVEVLLKKNTGKLNGWISYTWSRILLRMDDPIAGENINRGMYYPANYDMPHNATFIGNYRLSHRFSVSMNAMYSTGRPITLPIGSFYYAGSRRTLFADRNAFRIPDYFRTDFSMNIDGNHKVNQLFHNSFTIGVFNITGRKNPYSVYYVSEGGNINGYQLSIFGSAIPYINYNIRF